MNNLFTEGELDALKYILEFYIHSVEKDSSYEHKKHILYIREIMTKASLAQDK